MLLVFFGFFTHPAIPQQCFLHFYLIKDVILSSQFVLTEAHSCIKMNKIGNWWKNKNVCAVQSHVHEPLCFGCGFWLRSGFKAASSSSLWCTSASSSRNCWAEICSRTWYEPEDNSHRIYCSWFLAAIIVIQILVLRACLPASFGFVSGLLSCVSESLLGLRRCSGSAKKQKPKRHVSDNCLWENNQKWSASEFYGLRFFFFKKTTNRHCSL